MRSGFYKSSLPLRRGAASRGQLVVAGFLLAGVVVLGYGYFRQDKVGLYLGLAAIVAGVLSGVV